VLAPAQFPGGQRRPAATPEGAEHPRTGRRLAHHQLFFDRMKLRRANSPVRTYDRRGRPAQPRSCTCRSTGQYWPQLRLFDARRDFALFDELRSKNLANPWLVWAYYLAIAGEKPGAGPAAPASGPGGD